MHSNPLNDFAVLVFGNPLTAIWIALGLMIWCALIIVRNNVRYHKPLSQALKSRTDALAFIGAAESADEAQEAFAARFAEVNEAMMSGGRESAELRQAWGQFRETILDESAVPMGATARPEGYFLHLGDDTRILAWWANIFVALGLTFTFLGIVAALTSTVTALQTASSGNMTPALINLLTITSVKFWTSIAGVVASIILRWFDRRWHAATQRQLEEICDALERGTLFSPAQRIAAEQLRETKEQTAALKTFSHELAIAIQDSLAQQMAPMVSVLGGIQSSIDDFKSGSFNQIGKELSEAISRQAGNEMAQLGAALGQMAEKLSTIHEQIEGSGRAANEQIAAAARDFAAASERMNEMFDGLQTRVAETSGRMTTAADEAAQRAAAQFAEASESINAGFSKLREEMADYSAQLTRGAGEAAERNAEVLANAASALEQAAARAAGGMGEALDAAIGKAAEESAKAISAAFAAFGESFDQASAGLVGTLRSTAERVEALAASIERSTRASDDHAGKLAAAGAEAQGIATTLARAANDLESAATPIRSASDSIGSAVARTGEAVERQALAAEAHRTAIATISEKLGETTDVATRVWSDYRGRFEEVDKALAATLEKISAATSEHAAHLNEQVGKLDNALAGAVEKLAGALDPLTDLADQIEDLLGRLPRAA